MQNIRTIQRSWHVTSHKEKQSVIEQKKPKIFQTEAPPPHAKTVCTIVWQSPVKKTAQPSAHGCSFGLGTIYMVLNNIGGDNFDPGFVIGLHVGKGWQSGMDDLGCVYRRFTVSWVSGKEAWVTF